MASTITKTPFLRSVASRGYAQYAPVSGVPNYCLKTAVLPNKLVIVSGENESPIARVSIVFRAGSRNETADNLGVTHVIRTAAGLSTKNATQFAITRNIQQLGANLTASSDRETISYTLEGTKEAVQSALPFLAEVATQQVFKPWEVADLTNRLKYDLAVRPLQLRAVDLLHKAAFRSGLGNSLFIPKFKIGKISIETIQHYYASNFTSGRAAVVGIGIGSCEMKQFAEYLKLESDSGDDKPSKYHGGEIRSDKGGDFAFVAIAGEGASQKNPKEVLAAAVLQRILGVGPQVKWSSLDNGLLNSKIASCSDDYAASAINVSYSDSGLVGVLLAAPSCSAKKLVEGTVKVLKGSSISDAEVTKGKNQLKADLLIKAESGKNAIDSIGRQAAITGSANTSTELFEAVDSVSTSDVNNVLQKAAKKLTIASVGNLTNVPYADELKL